MEKCEPRMQPENVGECGGMSPHIFKWISLWELQSRWILEILNNDLNVHNSLDWKFPYTIGNILKRRCLKWGFIIHLNTYNTSYNQKRGWESMCQFDSQPLKIENFFDLCDYKGVCHIFLEIFWQRLQLCFRLCLNQRYAKKVTGIQCDGGPNFKDFRTPNLGVLGKTSFGCNLMTNHI